MRNFMMKADRYTQLSVRNQWLRGVSENGARPDHVLLDIGVLRGSDGEVAEWNCASLTPARARRVAAALIRAADEADLVKVRT